MELQVLSDADELGLAAAELFRDRVRELPTLAMAVPAGRTPRRMYRRLQELQAASPVDYARMHVFCVDELCPPAPADGHFWRQVRREFVDWARIPADRCHPFEVARPDLEAMCRDYERQIAECGGLDLVLLGLGPNCHVASNEPPCDPLSRTRPVALLPETVAYILTDDLSQGAVSDHAVTLGMGTILEAREVIVLVSGEAKREALARVLDDPESRDVPASCLRGHPRCTIIADRAAATLLNA